MKPKFLFILCSFLVSLGIISCIKDDVVPAGDAGKTFLKFNDGPTKAFFYSPFSDIKDVTVFNIRRDPNSEAALNKAQSVTVKLVPQLITDYNTANGTNFELLPANFYTYNFEPGMSVVGSDFTINYAAGEFAKNLAIKLDGAQWLDLSKSYALAYVVTNTAGNTLSTARDTMMTFFSIKNKYDGVYEVSGTMVDLLGTRFGRYPKTVELRTTGANQVIVVDMVEDKVDPWWYYQNAAGDKKLAFGLGFNLDLATDKVTSAFDAAQNGFTLDLDQLFDSNYDPLTKKLTVKWITGVNASNFPLGRFTVTETYTFQKDRE